MSGSKLAIRYAKALLDLAIEQNKVEVIYEDMLTIDKLMTNLEFAAVMRSPIIKSDKKQAIMKALLHTKIQDITLSFLVLLTGKHREANIKEIADAFVDQYNALKGIVAVTLTTATKADDSSMQLIQSLLKNKAGLENIQLVSKVKPSLIGGFTLNYQNKLYDASVLRQLQSLQNAVKEGIAG